MRKWTKVVSYIVAAALAFPAMAATEIKVPANRPFQHERTGIAFPTELGGLPRTQVLDFGAEQFDVAANYQAKDGSTIVTIYMYRAGFPVVAPSFDVILNVISTREGFSPDTKAKMKPQVFAPAGHNNADSMQIAFPVGEGGRFRTAGVALIPHGDWLLKVRVSTNRHDPDTLLQYMQRLANKLRLPAADRISPATSPVAPCQSELAFGDAHYVEADTAVAMAALMGEISINPQMGSLAELVAPAKATSWCRDEQFTNRPIYRPSGTNDRYVLVLGDSSEAVTVGRDASVDALRKANGDGPLFKVKQADANGTTGFGLLDALPRPDDLGRLLSGKGAVGSTDRISKVNINTDGAGEEKK